MLVLDSNVWIHAVTVGGDSKELVDEIIQRNETASVSAYIQEEVRTNLDEDHSIDRRIRDQALERFYGAVFQCPDIDTPPLEETEQIDLDDVREKAHNRLIGTFGDIQTKDAPVLTRIGT